MVIVVDGTVDTIDNLKSTAEDSKGKKLDFKEDKEGGTFTADGSDEKRYTINPTMAKISVVDVEAEKEKAAAAKPAASGTTKTATK